MLVPEETATRPSAPAAIADAVPVRALLLGERLDLRAFDRDAPRNTTPLLLDIPGGGRAALFRYGAAVLFGAPPEAAERRELGQRVLELLETLPTNQREVLRLKFQNGFSYQEISRISGHSISNVGYLIHAGIKTLRGQLFDGQPVEARA